MPAGRPRKPTALKKIAGTLQKCRTNANEPLPINALPAPPEHLSARGAELFRQHAALVAQMGIVSLGDGTALALLAARLEEVEIYSAVLEDLGHVQTTKTQRGEIVVRARPEVTMRSDAMRHAHALLTEFGLTPASRPRASSARLPDVDGNPFACL